MLSAFREFDRNLIHEQYASIVEHWEREKERAEKKQ